MEQETRLVKRSSVTEKIRIANGQGFWGDSILAPVRLVREGGIDYLTLDYLAEVTMGIMQKLKRRDPEKGYATDFVRLLDRLLPEIVGKDIKVIANAGGVNPEGCVRAISQVAERHGIYDLKLGTVTGDDIYPHLDDLIDHGERLENIETGDPLSTIRDAVSSANVYLGAFPIAEALEQGAQIVVTGRCTDPSLVVGPMIYEFGWGEREYDRLAAGTVAGHVIECGAQCTGGIYTDWREVNNMAEIGYPIIEVDPSGDFTVTKQPDTGGVVNYPSVVSQVVYEIENPREYLTPDVTADFTSFRVNEEGPDRVRVSGAKGTSPPDMYKVSISYSNGWKTVGELTVSGPDAIEKADLCADIVWRRLQLDGVTFGEDQKSVELLGTDETVKGAMSPPRQPGEVVLRIGVKDQKREKVERFGMELVPLVTSGPPGVTGFSGGRPKPSEIISYWPSLISREQVKPIIKIMEV